jgi:AmiR/NasT family two-component response regulator
MSDRRLRVVVADDDRDTREYLAEALGRMGHEVVGVAADGRTLVDLARSTSPDLVITDIKMPSLDGLEAGAAINQDRRVPVILLSAHHDDEMVERAQATPFMSYLIKPVTEADLRVAIPLAMTRYRQLRSLTEEADALRQAMQDRKLIERAKGILMKRLRIDEEDAFRRMRMMASNQNRKMTEISREVAAAEELFHRLEAIV